MRPCSAEQANNHEADEQILLIEEVGGNATICKPPVGPDDADGDVVLPGDELLAPNNLSSSGFVGVARKGKSGLWAARDRTAGVDRIIGHYSTSIEAARARRDWLGQVYGSSGKGDGHQPAYVPTSSPMVTEEEEEAIPGDDFLERSLRESQSGFVGVRKKAGAKHEYEAFHRAKTYHHIGTYPSALQAARARRDFLEQGFKENDTISEEGKDSECEDEVPT